MIENDIGGISRYSRRDFVRTAGAGIFIVSLGGALAACGGGEESPSAGAATEGGGGGETRSVNHQLGWLKISQFTGFFAAQEQGFYEENGIDATITAGGPNIIASQLVSAGRSLVGDDDNTTVLQALDKGQPLIVYGAIFQKSPYAVMSYPDNPIETLEDFADKTVALTEATRPQLIPLLEDAGVDPATVEFVPAGPDPSQLASKQVDGYFGYATAQGVSLEQQGLDIVITYFNDLGFPSYANVLITKPETVEQERDTLVRFLRGTIMGYEYSLAHPDEMGELVATKYGPEGLDVETEIAVHKAQATLIESPNGVLSVDGETMAAAIDAAAAAGSISKALPVDEVVTTEILEEAYGGETSLLEA
jgi:NitT/TauT family transport system substrate-binding protein